MAAKSIDARRIPGLGSLPDQEGMLSLDKSKVIKKKTKEKSVEHSTEMDRSEDLKKEMKSSYILVGVIIAIVLITVGFMLIPKMFDKAPDAVQESYEYNLFKFEKRFGTWFTESQEGNNLFEIALIYAPKELENVIVEGSVYSFRQMEETYITFDPTEKEFSYVTMANAEVATKLAMHFGIKMLPACTEDTETCRTAGAEIITCEANRTMEPGKGIIFLNQAPGPKVIIDGNCAIIQGEGADIIKAADRFMLGYYGIMK
jgi:hypothetical protein